MTTEHLYSYEGNKPHPIIRVFFDGGSLCCEHCTACVCDHEPVSEGAPPISELRWVMTTTVRLERRSGWSVSGCNSNVEDDPLNEKAKCGPTIYPEVL